MVNPRPPRLTATELLSAASDTLERGGYRRVDDGGLQGWPNASRAFEDRYAIVAVFVYETWHELSTAWPDAQGALVELISKFLTRAEPKAWEGYLVLLTAASPDSSVPERRAQIRYDTSRVRKLVATGAELRTISDVERALLPLLPLVQGSTTSFERSVLHLLPRILGEQQLDEKAASALVEAFLAQEPLLERLHAHRLRS